MSSSSTQEQIAAAGTLNCPAVHGVFDEMREQPGKARTHWRPFIESLQQLGVHELRSRAESGKRILREHGVTYSQYGDPAGMERPWGLDLVPLIITAQEWAGIEAGLVQRSRLFNLILADIYGGPQRLLRDGFIPPELVYANEWFLRPCRGTRIPQQVYVHLHGCDLGRSPDGCWWVLSDRTQAPSGSGYAWENRTVISRLLPEQIRDSRVQRLTGFFQRQREMLFKLAPPQVKFPSIVLLTPGPANQAYFEDAYLARHLGLPLVEGADLTVRNRHVFLKTIEGLQRVDLIFRRVDDSFCDPLELRGDSLLGISGLVEASRAGNVTIANALGAGLMESPAFLPFLPGLCRYLLGEELLLPSIGTWWCGQPAELQYVQEHLPGLIIKPAFRPRGSLPLPVGEPQKPRGKGTQWRRALLRMLQASPQSFVAQESVKLSRAPVWTEEGLQTRSLVLRAFVATDGNAFSVLPGGLARVASDPDDFLVSVASGQTTKDTWVTGEILYNSDTDALQVQTDSRVAEPVQIGVPSRVADHLFWLGRYTERLEQMLRVLRCVLGRVSGELSADAARERQALAHLIVKLGLLAAPIESLQQNGELSTLTIGLLYDPEAPGGIRLLLKRIRFIASAVRDRFSGDTWRILGRLEADSRVKPGQLPVASATALIHNLVLDLAAFNGTEMENMTRGRGWRFLDFGRRLERASSMLSLLSAVADIPLPPAVVLEPVLEIADSVMTYRRQYFDAPRFADVLELLLRDESNPRALSFQLKLLAEHAVALSSGSDGHHPKGEESCLANLAAKLRSAEFKRLGALLSQKEPAEFLALLEDWTADLAALSDQVTSRYFSHTFPSQS